MNDSNTLGHSNQIYLNFILINIIKQHNCSDFSTKSK